MVLEADSLEYFREMPWRAADILFHVNNVTANKFTMDKAIPLL